MMYVSVISSLTWPNSNTRYVKGTKVSGGWAS